MNKAAKIIVVLFVLFVSALGGALYFFWQYKKSQATPSGTTGDIASTQEIEQTVALLSQHVVLPDGETPTVATITDTSTLAGQDFFKNANIGDKVVVYAQARIAILYNPAIDRIVNMAQINPAEGALPAPQEARDTENATTSQGEETVVQ